MKTSQVATVGRKPKPYPGNSIELRIIRAEIARTCGQVIK